MSFLHQDDCPYCGKLVEYEPLCDVEEVTCPHCAATLMIENDYLFDNDTVDDLSFSMLKKPDEFMTIAGRR